MLPDNYIRRMKQALGEVEAKVEDENRRERILDDRPAYDFDQTPPADDCPTGIRPEFHHQDTKAQRGSGRTRVQPSPPA
jgi:hypothetical protein